LMTMKMIEMISTLQMFAYNNDDNNDDDNDKLGLFLLF
jgi:hypothetical protein